MIRSAFRTGGLLAEAQQIIVPGNAEGRIQRNKDTLLPELSDPSEDGYFLAEAFAIAAIILGLFSLLFFTQPAPREAIADVSIARSVTSRGNACFVMASLVFLSDLVLMILGDRGLNAFG